MEAKLTKALRDRGMAAGADIVGIADVAELEGKYDGASPTAFLPGAIRVAVAVAADPPGIVIAEDNFEYSAIALSGYARADAAARSIAELLKSKGHRTYIIERSAPMARSASGRFVKNISMKHAAQAAGVGMMGWHRLVVSPEFGPRMRFAGVVTDAPIDADAPFDTELCNGCGACVAACPASAVGQGGTYDINRCMLHLFSGIKLRDFDRGNIDLNVFLENARRVAAVARGWARSISETRPLYYNCGKCVQVCKPGSGRAHAKTINREKSSRIRKEARRTDGRSKTSREP